MTALGLDDIEAFPFVDAPDKRHIQDGIKLLEELGAFETVRTKAGEKRQLTAVGVNYHNSLWIHVWRKCY